MKDWPDYDEVYYYSIFQLLLPTQAVILQVNLVLKQSYKWW